MDKADIKTLNSVSFLRLSVGCIILERVNKILTNGRYVNFSQINSGAVNIENGFVNSKLILLLFSND